MPTVSVIATVYNTGKFLDACVESVLTQKWEDFELIIVDDGSDEDTMQVLLRLKDTDPRIKMIFHNDNKGAGFARNTGLSVASGDFVSFIDTDDIWDNEFLETMLATLRQPGAATGAFCWSRIIDEDGVKIGVQDNSLGQYDLRRYLVEICPPGNGSCLMWRRKALVETGGFSNRHVGEDSESWLKILAAAPDNKLVCVPRMLISYRSRPGSLSTRRGTAQEESFDFRLSAYLPLLQPAERWQIIYKFIKKSKFAGPRLNQWRKKTARRALKEGGLHLLMKKDGWVLVAGSLFGWPAALRLKDLFSIVSKAKNSTQSDLLL